MADALFRTEPVPADAVDFGSVIVALEPPMARYSLRARSLAEVGTELPTTIGDIQGGAIMLGPDEWLLRLPAGSARPVVDGMTSASVVDISERQIAISIEGTNAARVLQAGNPLDLENFRVGTGKRTVFEGVEVILMRESDERFVVEVWRSFAEFVWGVLTKAASEL